MAPTCALTVALLAESLFTPYVSFFAGTLAVRARWSEHFSGAQGIMFVVNAAGDAYEVLAARETLHAALEHRRLANLPLLLLATNQDRSELARSCDAVRCTYSYEYDFSVPEYYCTLGRFSFDTNWYSGNWVGLLYSRRIRLEFIFCI